MAHIEACKPYCDPVTSQWVLKRKTVICQRKEWFTSYHQDSMGAAYASGASTLLEVQDHIGKLRLLPALWPGAGFSALLPLKLAGSWVHQ